MKVKIHCKRLKTLIVVVHNNMLKNKWKFSIQIDAKHFSS